VATNVGNDFTFQYPDTTKDFLGADLSNKVRATIYGLECKEDNDSPWYATAGYVPVPFSTVTTPGGVAAFVSPNLGWSTTTTMNEDGSIGYSTEGSDGINSQDLPENIVDNTDLVEFTFTTVPSVMAQISDITSSGLGNDSLMEFCVRVGLYATDDDGMSEEINFQETIVTLTVTMDGSFDITSFGVAPKDKTSDSAQQTYTVSAALCTENQAEMDSTGRFNQGAAILVCISPDTQAKNDGVIMTSIDTFVWKREYVDGSAPTLQTAIKSPNAVADNELTLIDTTNTETFIVTSVLFAAFYATTGQVSANGSATMAFTSAAAAGRRLRNLQDGDTSTVAPFEMTANLNRADDGPVAYVQTAAATGAGTSITVVATIVGLVSAMLLA